ncbi:hypothetical protein P775_20760 [Puniceibacterium antarcticum]|uniref:HTH deoR-type domain-containing protein n=1 Tax=Puniceibacterium antarcticum TaxID=1206336 RepID=A0A2G8R9N6_9RHOB|nr:DeoR/GlpR family DNA-binding transcription regulator [Puniceibacterium antarcticum]PIL18276.1 hypothetical protein P775_20760 [Puniceibacterium antarcticum]
MWTHERHSRIIEELSKSGKVNTRVLADLLSVSRETIRRDFLDLEECGTLKRVHGGAVLSGRQIAPEPAFSDRLTANADAKRDIGKEAAAHIQPGSTLFIDAGTTTLAFVREILFHRDVRIITNSIEIAKLVAPTGNLEVLLLGGKPHAEVPATYGELTLSEVDRFLADFAVISPVGFHPTRGATDYELHEAEVARRMIRCSKSCIMLCHSDKLTMESRVAICRPEEVDHLITDSKADRGFSLPRGEVHFARPHETDVR